MTTAEEAKEISKESLTALGEQLKMRNEGRTRRMRINVKASRIKWSY